MKLKVILFITLIVVIVFSGCELLTQPTVNPKPAVGTELVITEVFTLPPNQFNAYSWIEVFNPTSWSIPWYSAASPISMWIAGDNGTIIWKSEMSNDLELYHSSVVPKFNSITHYSIDTIFAAGDNGKLYRSNDTGRTWSIILNKSKNFNCITTLDAWESNNNKMVWACGDSGTYVRSIDRGHSFTNIVTNRKNNLHHIFALDITNQYVCGDSIIMKSINGGRLFENLILPSAVEKESFRCASFISIPIGRVCGTNGTILYTDINGAVWQPETTNVSVTLNAITSISGLDTSNATWQRAWAVGDNGTILMADSAGPTTWHQQVSGTTANLHSVTFLDTLWGIVTGDGGVILYTTNSGNTWNRIPSGTTENLYSISVLPIFHFAINYYALEVYAQRRHLYYEDDVFGRRTVNADFVTKIDTGYVRLKSEDGGQTIDPGGFIVFVSDSGKFNDHTQVGPSKPSIKNKDTTSVTIRVGDVDKVIPVKWNLLSSSEIRLIKVTELREFEPPYDLLQSDSSIIEVVRFGNFNLATDYPQNISLPPIPEWWSIARYQDMTSTNVSTFNSNKYFYLCNKPIPGWISQLRSY